jgi:hypothetical protein
MRPAPLRILAAVVAAGAVVACGGRLERAPARGAERPAAADSEAIADVQEEEAQGGFSSEAERTRAMEAQAADLRQQYEDAMASAATEEEKIRAYQEFEQGRQELNEISDDGDGGDDAYAPPPVP